MSGLRFFIKEPTGQRRSWAIVAYTRENGVKVYQPFTDARVDALNARIHSGEKINPSLVRMQLEEIIKEKYRASSDLTTKLRGVSLSDDNLKVFTRFWNEKYRRKDNKDLEASKGKFTRALRLIDPLHVLNAQVEALDEALKKASDNQMKRRTAALKLNEIRAHFGLKERLVVVKEPRREIKYLTEKEVEALSLNATPEVRSGILTLFASGLRIGEALALKPHHIRRPRGLYISEQFAMKRGEIDEPKWGSSGLVKCIPKFWDDVVQWIDIDEKDTRLYEAIYDYVTVESRKLWPSKKIKHISPHDLRHSHAIYLIERGASLEDVAKNLRNSILTCQKYYTGFMHTDGTADRLDRLLTRN